MKLCEYCMAEFEPKRPDQNTVDQNAPKDLRSLRILKRLEELCIQEHARNVAEFL